MVPYLFTSIDFITNFISIILLLLSFHTVLSRGTCVAMLGMIPAPGGVVMTPVDTGHASTSTHHSSLGVARQLANFVVKSLDSKRIVSEPETTPNYLFPRERSTSVGYKSPQGTPTSFKFHIFYSFPLRLLQFLPKRTQNEPYTFPVNLY